MARRAVPLSPGTGRWMEQNGTCKGELASASESRGNPVLPLRVLLEPPSVSLEEFSLSPCVHLCVSFSHVFTSSARIYRMANGRKLLDKKTDFVQL
jgi:hypothetical protein